MLAIAVSLSLAGIGNVSAQSAEGVAPDIPAQRLDLAIQEFAKARNLQVLYRTEVLEGMQSGPVRSDASDDDALKALLGGADLTVEYIGDRTISIDRVRSNQYASLGAGVARTNASSYDLARSVGALAMQAAPAAEPEVQQLDAVRVTGSRLSRTEVETSNPVVVMEREQIEASGAVTLGEVVSTLSQISGGITSPASNGGVTANGGTTINLRGMGEGRTLVLLDGRRLNNADANSVPTAMIERVEVLMSGAGAIYGADAIAGVVNFITRQDFDGLEFKSSYGITERGDGQQVGASLIWGSVGGNSSTTFGLEYTTNRGIESKNRSNSANPEVYFAGDLSPNAILSFPRTGAYEIPGSALASQLGCDVVTLREGATGQVAGDYRCFNGNRGLGETDRINVHVDNYIWMPTERYSVFGGGNRLFDNGLEVYASGFFTSLKGGSRLAGLPMSSFLVQDVFDPAVYGDPVISSESIYNPFGVDVAIYDRRLSGYRHINFDTQDFHGSVGVKGAFGDRFSWDANYSYGRTSQTNDFDGVLNLAGFLTAVGPSYFDADGVARCGVPGAPIAGCTPVNMFSDWGNGIDSLMTAAINRTDYDTQSFSFDVAGDLFDLPAGVVGAAFGLQHHKFAYEFRPDAAAAAGYLSEGGNQATNGRYDVSEAYLEAGIPLLDSLRFNLGLRYSDYSSFGDTTNAKYALEWRPLDGLLLRATYSDVYRAPTTIELYQGGSAFSPGYTDPCAGLSATELAAHAGACANVPVGYVQTHAQTQGMIVGNPNAIPEEGYSRDIGIVYNPSFYRPLTVSLDYWEYSLNRLIGSMSLQNVLEACFEDSSSAFCGIGPTGEPYFSRSPSGNIIGTTLPYVNANSDQTSGYDMDLRLNYVDVAPFGIHFDSIRVGTTATYLKDYTRIQRDPITLEVIATPSLLDASTSRPKLKFQTFLFWEKGSYGGMIRHRFIDHIEETNIDLVAGAACAAGGDTAEMGGRTVYCRRTLPTMNYVDLAVGRSILDGKGKVTLGVNDVLDKGFHKQYTVNQFGFPNSLYNMQGRNYFVQASFDF